MHYPEEAASSSFFGFPGFVSLDPIPGKDLHEIACKRLKTQKLRKEVTIQ